MACEHCGCYGYHLSGCPLAPEPPIYSKCEACGEEIYDGDEYYEIDGHDYCEACVCGGYKTAEID